MNTCAILHPRTLAMAFMLAWATLSFAQTTVLFDKDSYVITAAGRTLLHDLAQNLKQGNPAEEIALIGHTDPDAGDAYNQTLSFNRATAVRTFLQNQGVKNKIHLESKGESRLLTTSTQEPEMGRNRRVEIIRNYSENNFAFDQFKKALQEFTVNPNKDTTLVCAGGTSLEIAAKSLNLKDNSLPVTFKIQEYTTKSDFILANLTTQTANNEVLETGGMLNIEAWQGNEKVELKEGKSVNLRFQSRTEDDRMQLFNGDAHDNHVVWTPAPGARDTGWQYGVTTVSIANNLVSTEKWKYIKIKGVKYKVSELMMRGQTSYDTVQAATESITREMMMSSTRLGWINCDRFKGGPKTDIAIEYKGEFTPNIVAVFSKINSILPYTYRENNRVIFKNVPAGQEVTFIGMFKEEDSPTMLYAQKKLSSDCKSGSLSFEEMKPDEVKEKIKVL